MKFKKILALSMTALMSFGLLAGCGQSKDGEDSATGDSSDSKEVTLRVSWWGGDTRHQATLDTIKAFEAENPGIKIKAEYGAWQGWQEKITTQISGKTEADVMQINWNWLANYSKDGEGFYNLYDLKEELGLDNFDEDILKAGEMEGKLNGIPLSTTARVMFLNKTTYDKFGVELPKTFDDYFEAAKKFEDGYYPMDLDNYSAWLMMVSYVQQKTGKEFVTEDGKLNFTKDDLKMGLEFYKKLVDEKVVPSVEARAGEGGETPLYEMPKYLNGSFAGVYEWTSSASKYSAPLEEQNQELVLSGTPIMDGAKTTGVAVKPSMLFAISKNTKHPKEAAKFLNFVLNEDAGVEKMALERGIPSSNAAVDVLESNGKLEGLEYEATGYVNENKGLPMSLYQEDAQLQDVYKSTIEQLGYGQLDISGAVDYAYENITTILTELTK